METIVCYSLPPPSHLISMVELAKLLLAKNPNLSITIISPPNPNDNGFLPSYTTSISSTFPCITFHFLPLAPLLLGNPSNYENVEHILFEILYSSKPHVDEFLQGHSLSSPISACILDFFWYPAFGICKSFNIPTYFYLPTNASFLALFLNIPEFDKIVGVEGVSFRSLGMMPFCVPGLFSIPANSILEPMLDRGVAYDEFVNLGAHLAKCDGIVINTFEELEPRVVKALREGSCVHGTTIPSVYCVGPLIANQGKKGSQGGGGEEDERNECLRWLDLQPTQSVVYLCFGSMGWFSKEQIEEIGLGLERSGVRFLWVVRAPPSEDKAKKFEPPPELDLDLLLPVGFLDRTKDRGLVVKSWVPQIEILGHKATGGFVTHCGWNSVLEAVCAGVPMVAWPLYAEQRFNKIMLVEEIGIALPMNESRDRFVESNEIERRVKQVISSKEGEVIRKRVLELSHEAKAAFGEGGSSKVALAKLVASLKKQ